MTFLGSGEPNKVPLFSLPYVYSMLPQSEGVVDWARIFVTACMTTKLKTKETNEKKKVGVGNISMGVWLPLLLIYLEWITLSLLPLVEGICLI